MVIEFQLFSKKLNGYVSICKYKNDRLNHKDIKQSLMSIASEELDTLTKLRMRGIFKNDISVNLFATKGDKITHSVKVDINGEGMKDEEFITYTAGLKPSVFTWLFDSKTIEEQGWQYLKELANKDIPTA